ncbi:MAG: hypothetical protein J5590_07145 [Clostridia bacterium]|nr:hypothetical protein [Clostridia bacterium]
MHGEKHFRHELKYAIPYGDYLAMRARLKMIMTPDPHTVTDGKYKIRSIYFDNSDDKASAAKKRTARKPLTAKTRKTAL